ncbi:MAG: Zn-dependent hydrolase [Deltaproteobacteria bacterium]|jgi:allantoate deiminase|nr:Zn-dependent hydrolase [Deltaproteobacteria bacterium]MBK8696302.1 Zn-dependent hydrolase [Deltaproteobacteria bacterium]MBP6833388.1 Zn-dependent hydrolase [Deltaproteobacteria bacterium]
MPPVRTKRLSAPSSKRVIADLRELAARTSTERGAQRVAWGPVWREARAWFVEKVKTELGLPVETDPAGNAWVTLPGASKRGVVFGSHLDSVPGGGWLDGVLGVVAGIEALRRHAAAGTPPVTMHLVDWADEEGARYGRSLTGSAASAGTLDAAKELAHLVDRNGVKLPDALRENGVELDRMGEAHAWLKARDPRAYVELHIEQGPVLEAMKKPVGVVLGTMGVERHMVRFTGQAVHAGATPIPLRQDAFLAAAEFALACRDIGLKFSGRTPKTRVVATCGVVKVEPGFVTAVSGATDISLDLRALDGAVLAKMQSAAEKASRAAAKKNRCTVAWSPLLSIDPRPFDPDLLALCAESVREVTGEAPKLPSGPLHDAAEMAGIMPTVMVFAQSSPGISHTRLEDTPIPHLDKSIKAFLRLVEKTVDHVAGGDE